MPMHGLVLDVAAVVPDCYYSLNYCSYPCTVAVVVAAAEAEAVVAAVVERMQIVDLACFLLL
jgi:hypothetical protein